MQVKLLQSNYGRPQASWPTAIMFYRTADVSILLLYFFFAG